MAQVIRTGGAKVSRGKKPSRKKTTTRSQKKTKKKTKKKTTKKTASSKTTKKKTTKRTTKKTTKKTKSKATRKQTTTRATRKKTSRKATRRPSGRDTAAPADLERLIKVGFHLGNTRTMVAASLYGQPLELTRDVFRNLVGYLKMNLRDGSSRDRADAVFADDAIRFRRQLNLRRPIRAGTVVDAEVCQQFAAYMCSVINPSGSAPLWGVVSVPADATSEQRARAHRGMSRSLNRTVLVPEPYLVAEGMHTEPEYREGALRSALTRGSLVIDIGSVKTDLCLVRGDFPTEQDHVNFGRAGNYIDDQIMVNGLFYYPSLDVTRTVARQIKEEQAYVSNSDGHSQNVAEINSELILLNEVIRRACEYLLTAIVDASCVLLERCGSESAQISSNTIVTGGGSKIRNLPHRLQQWLRERGYPHTRVLVPSDHQTLVARGALRFAESLSDDAWETLSAAGARPQHGRPVAPLREPVAVATSSQGESEGSQFAAALSDESPTDVPLKGFSSADLDELDFFKGLGQLDRSR